MQGRGMAGGSMRGIGTKIPQGSDSLVATFRIDRRAEESRPLPARLVPIKRFKPEQTANPGAPLPIAILMRRMQWMLNGRTFEGEKVMAMEKVPLDSLQLIEIDNSRGGMGMAMTHPIHLHGQQFHVVKRDSAKVGVGYASVKDGFITSGWKDTVLVMPGEKVTILKPFEDYTGLFLYHCHNLEHEDMDMMLNFLVG